MANWTIARLYTNGVRYRIPLWRGAQTFLVAEYDHVNLALASCGENVPPEWAAITGDPYRHVHRLFLLGSEERFEQFFDLLAVLGGERTGWDTPLHHVTYLQLRDCRDDASPAFRRAVVDPVLLHATIVGHIEWAIRYRREGELGAALSHVDASLDAIEQAQTDPWILTEDRQKALRDVCYVLRARLRVSSELGGTISARGCEQARADLSKVSASGETTYSYALATYELAVTIEVAATRLAARRRLDRSTTDVLFRSADALLDVCLQRVASGGTQDQSRTLLRAAACLARARIENASGWAAAGLTRHIGPPTATARTWCEQALSLLDSISTGPTAAAALLRGCCEVEIGNAETARREWQAAGSAEALPSIKAASAYNQGLLSLLTGDLPGAAATVRLLPDELPFCRNEFYRHVERVAHKAGVSLAAGVEARLARQAHPPLTSSGSGNAALAAQRQWATPITDLASLSSIVTHGDVVRWRASRSLELDLLWVRHSLKCLDEFILTSLDSPFAPSGMPAEIWSLLTSRSRGLLYSLIVRSMAGEATGPDFDQALCGALLELIDKLVWAPLRVVQCGRGVMAWQYIPSPTASGTATASASLVPGAVIKHSTPGVEWTYDWKDLYFGKAEYSLLEALLKTTGAAAFAKPALDSLATLSAVAPDMVGMLIGPTRVRAGCWSGTAMARSREHNRLHAAMRAMKRMRDHYAHNGERMSNPSPEDARAAWLYLATTAAMVSAAGAPTTLGAKGIWTSASTDPRRHWAVASGATV